MVKGETGTLTLDVRTAVDRRKRPLFLKNNYFYTTINDTPFSFGMVLTRGHGQYMFHGNVSIEEGLHDLQQPDLTIASDWTYCETDIDPQHRKLTQLQAVVRYLTGKDPDLECDEVLLQQTLFDAVVTAPLEAYWTALMLSDTGVVDGVEAAFLGTRSGLMRVIRYTGNEEWKGKNFLTPVDKENLFTMDHHPIWYRLAAENKPGQFYYYVPVDDVNKEKNMLIAVTAVTVTERKRTALAGAIGIQMSLSLLERRFWATAKQANDTDCSNVDGLCPLSCESIDINCYLVDNNGFTVISKERSDVGRFFGEVDGSVMAQLLKSGLFKRVTLYDYQAMCKNTHHHASAARPLLSPFYSLMAAVKWLFSNLMLFFWEFNICGLWHNDYLVDAHKQKKIESMVPCNTEYPGFMYDTSIRETNSIIKCGRCQKMFVLQQVLNSNLVMLVVQADCDCSRQYSPITLTPREVKYILLQLFITATD
ncbi:hypothetical protein PDJAM_G00234310 [Pangasius djambal]|uniref:Uncharacterized protein n=1 Tax=Pangasius djambal TaxID=1691987 RepID=A0ACC5YFS8_9TELE|nr:hypothetical protein [Pangasius djambal]